MSDHDSVQRLLDAYQSSGISRREVMKRAAALGISIPAIAALLAKVAPVRAAGSAPGAHNLTRQQDATPVPGGTLREGYDLDFSRMDPINTTWYDPGFYALYEHAITIDPDSKYVPQLAESWEVSDDGLALTLKIREGVKFHSGAPLDAAAIKSVYDTIKDPASASPLGSLFNPVASIDAPDATTVVLNFSAPYADIFNVISTGYWAIVNTAVRAQLGDQYGLKQIDGSGPFTFVEWVPGSHVDVKRWDDYAGSIVPYFQNKGKAYLDGIRWTTILEQSQRAIQIENSEIDTVHAPAFQDVPRLEGNGDLNLVRLKEWSGYFIGLNFKRTQFDFQDVKMRQAVSKAINRPAIVDALLFGEGEPLYGPITTADRYYAKEVEAYNQYDVDGAKALVSELGWTANGDGVLEKNGTALEFNLVVQAESLNQQFGQVIQDQLKQIGMKVNVVSLDRGTFFGDLGAPDGVDSHLFYWAWPVPADIIQIFISTGTMGGPNWSFASVPAVDDAIKAWQTAANEDELRAAAKQMQVSVAENLPIVSLVNRNSVYVNRKTVHGYLPHQWNLYPYYNDVWLEQ
jgi:peptide/nickel transport system substrate-binding protein